MPEYTPFAGLLRLAPGEPLSTDGFAFLTLNPEITDRLLRVGAVSHRHDAHLALVHADPSPDPVVAALDSGGTIASDLELHVGYTLVDADGGETVLNEDTVVVTTDPGLEDPDSSPVAAIEHDAGTLLADNYEYAVTLTDGGGGETGLSPSASITIDPGYPTSRVRITGLTAILASVPGAVTWRLWRMIGSGRWTMMIEGAGDEALDDGSLAPDCGASPPAGGGITRRVNRLQVTVPAAGQPDGATRFRVYASLDGSFRSPCLMGDYPVAELDDVKEYTQYAPDAGSPPTVPTAIGGANRIDALTDILNLSWRAPVADEAGLPGAGNAEGDARVALDTGHIWRYIGGDWMDEPGGSGGGGGWAARQTLAAAGITFGTDWSLDVRPDDFLDLPAYVWVDSEGFYHLYGRVRKSTAPANGDDILWFPGAMAPAAGRDVYFAVGTGGPGGVKAGQVRWQTEFSLAVLIWNQGSTDAGGGWVDLSQIVWMPGA